MVEEEGEDEQEEIKDDPADGENLDGGVEGDAAADGEGEAVKVKKKKVKRMVRRKKTTKIVVTDEIKVPKVE